MNYDNYMAETLSAVANGVVGALDETPETMTSDQMIEREEELERMIDEHKCTLSENKKCDCSGWYKELRELTGTHSIIH